MIFIARHIIVQDMTPDEFDYEKARKFLEKKYQEKQSALAEDFRRAWRESDAIIEMIKKKYNPAKIYRWGSLLDQNHFSKISDIDIAVEGITSPEDFFKLCADAMEMTSFPLDIVQMEKIEPEFAEIIKLKGKIVYER